MPCYRVQKKSVDLNQADHDRLEAVLVEQGWKVTREKAKSGRESFSFRQMGGSRGGVYQNNQLIVDSSIDTNKIKVGYSQKVCEQQAEVWEKKGWTVAREGNQFKITKPVAAVKATVGMRR